jgi:hypothetical protein
VQRAIWRTIGELEAALGDDQNNEADEAVIARAFRRSLAVFAALALVALAVGLWIAREPAPPKERSGVAERPMVAPDTSGSGVPDLRFTDVTASAGIAFTHVSGAYGERLLPETMGGGVAFLDYDADGDQDLLLVNSMHWPWNEAAGGPAPTSALYRNDGSGHFEDVSEETGIAVPIYGMGVAVGDYDNDGWVDVYLTAVGENRLLRNIAGKRFEDVTAEAGVGGDASDWSTSAAFVDYDRDGDLDLFAANYVRWSREIDFEVDYQLTGIGRAYGPPTNYAGTQSYLFRNDGGGRFANVSDLVAVTNPATGEPAGKGLGVVPVDVNLDGWPDLIVANDTVGNFLFINDGGRGFVEDGANAGLAFDAGGAATGAMGIDAAWLGGEDMLAVAIGNFANEMSSLFVAETPGGVFTDEAVISGIGPASRKVLSFGLFFFDVDLDGRDDLFQANGHVENEIAVVQPSQTYAQPPQIFWNCGDACARRFVPASVGGDFNEPRVGRGAAFADIDADGDLDIALTAVGGPARLLRNDLHNGNNWLRLQLADTGPIAGARIVLSAGGRRQLKIAETSRSYLSQTEAVVTFGLGSAEQIEKLEITWPDGVVETLEPPGPNAVHTIRRRR